MMESLECCFDLSALKHINDVASLSLTCKMGPNAIPTSWDSWEDL